MIDAVIDSSVILADLFGEPGGEIARPAARTATMSAINFAEVISKLVARGVPERDAIEMAYDFDMQVTTIDAELAEAAGVLHGATRSLGISIGDAFCLALAGQLGVPVLTGDRRWAALPTDVEVRLIR